MKRKHTYIGPGRPVVPARRSSTSGRPGSSVVDVRSSRLVGHRRLVVPARRSSTSGRPGLSVYTVHVLHVLHGLHVFQLFFLNTTVEPGHNTTVFPAEPGPLVEPSLNTTAEPGL